MKPTGKILLIVFSTIIVFAVSARLFGKEYHGSGPGGNKTFNTRQEYMSDYRKYSQRSNLEFYTIPGYNYINGLIIGGSWGLLFTLFLFRSEFFRKE